MISCAFTYLTRTFVMYHDDPNSTSPWRVETKRYFMEKEPEWLDDDDDDLQEEEVSNDVPLPRETNLK
jgi:hypothetical protein